MAVAREEDGSGRRGRAVREEAALARWRVGLGATRGDGRRAGVRAQGSRPARARAGPRVRERGRARLGLGKSVGAGWLRRWLGLGPDWAAGKEMGRGERMGWVVLGMG